MQFWISDTQILKNESQFWILKLNSDFWNTVLNNCNSTFKKCNSAFNKCKSAFNKCKSAFLKCNTVFKKEVLYLGNEIMYLGNTVLLFFLEPVCQMGFFSFQFYFLCLNLALILTGVQNVNLKLIMTLKNFNSFKSWEHLII